MVLDIFALVVMGVLVAFVILLVVKLGPIPGNIATSRGHPQADAIWAYTRSGEQHADYLSERVATLEAELSALKIQGGDA